MSVQKVALITASSAGLGAQIARAFAPDFRIVSRQLTSYCTQLRHLLYVSFIDSLGHQLRLQPTESPGPRH